MKKNLFFILIFVSTVSVKMNSQTVQPEIVTNESNNAERVSLTVGVLQGGGGLVGADFEALLSNRVGF